MKIGILTVPFNNNYGGYLQAYALMTVLKKEGHDVTLIYRKHNYPSLKVYLKYALKSIFWTLRGKGFRPIILDPEYELRMKGMKMMPFVDKYITPKTPPLYSSQKLKAYCEYLFDVVIVGSDQVWRPEYVPNIEDFFLKPFEGQNIKRISYAASFGSANVIYSPKEQLECGRLLSLFDSVSVREKSGIDTISQMGWNCKSIPAVVLDPTMLLEHQMYEKHLNLQENTNEIFCYVLDEDSTLDTIINKIVENGTIETLFFYKQKDKKEQKKLSIEEWLGHMKYAKFVVTDSFHGTVFCLIFNTPFVVYANVDRGYDRFKTLLGHFDLMDRIVSTPNAALQVVQQDIDWHKVNEQIRVMRNSSLEWLRESLK